MADYIAQCRSNYFKVKDEHQYQQFCARYGLGVIVDKDGNAPPCYGFMEYGSLPSPDDDADKDFITELSQHLADGEIAVVMEIGSEKMRYLIGCAFAVNSKGEQVEVSLNEIYRKAKEVFGIAPSQAEY